VALRVEPFDRRRHDRSGFSCGEPSLDEYLARQATQDIRREIASLFCLVDDEGSPTPLPIAGYYTLCASSVRLRDLPPDRAKHLPSYPDVPAVLLGRLAVSLDLQRAGLGGQLLGEALRRCRALRVAAWCVVVDALNDRAAAWYKAAGFVALDDQPRRLILPAASVSPRRSSGG
jgi:GNAT superfamily N-acetyltransferase